MSPLTGSLPSLLAATVAFAIGTSVVLRDRSRDDFVLFAVFCFNLGLFHLASFFHEFSAIPLFRWGAQSISLVLPWTGTAAFHASRRRAPARAGAQTAIWSPARAHAAAVHPAQSLARSRARGGDAALLGRRRLGPGICSARRTLRGRRARAGRPADVAAASCRGHRGPRLRYLFFASVAAIAFGPRSRRSARSSAVYLYFVAQTLNERCRARARGRILTLTLLIMAVTGVLALLLMWIPYKTEGGWSLFLFNSAVAAFAVIVLLDPVRQEFDSRVESWLFRDRAELRALLVHLRFKLLNVIRRTRWFRSQALATPTG
jgi:hypothetical protein